LGLARPTEHSQIKPPKIEVVRAGILDLDFFCSSSHIITVLTRFFFNHIFAVIDSSLNFFMKVLPVVFILSAILFSNCKKDNGNPGPQPGGDGSLNVYLAGNDQTGDGSVPCFWKNDTKTILPNTNGGTAHSLSVEGSNVYVAGRSWVDNAQTRFSPCYWLNGTRKDLPLMDVRGNGMANSIVAFNGTVYAAGTCSDSLEFFANSGWRKLPCYWKNGQLIKLELLNGFGNGSASSMTLIAAPNRIITYIVGTSYAQSGFDEPCYWKIDPQGITTPGADIDATALGDKGYGGSALNASPGNANQILNDPYIAGFVNNADDVNDPCFWHNGTRTELSKITPNGHGAATAIDYAGNDVYAAGYTGNTGGTRVPCMWKNGTRTDLPLPAGANSGEATSIRIHGADIYVGGTFGSSNGEFPCYWKNGKIVQYNSRGSASSIALNEK